MHSATGQCTANYDVLYGEVYPSKTFHGNLAIVCVAMWSNEIWCFIDYNIKNHS